jgi:DUF1009 family protein
MPDKPSFGKLGLVAGGGDLPLRLADAARAAGRPLYVLALEGSAAPALAQSGEHGWVRIGALGEALRMLHAAGVEEVCFAGKVKRPSLRELRPDARGAKFIARVGWRALGDDGMMGALIKELAGEGFRVVGPDAVLGDLLVAEGALGALLPDAQALSDIARGRAVVEALGALDVGQAAVVQQGMVLGVEAIEHTDALLARCGGLRRGGPGGVLVKLAKPGQERRVDLPTIGPSTVVNAHAAGLRGIAIEAGATLVLDRAAVAAEADRLGLFVVALAAGA